MPRPPGSDRCEPRRRRHRPPALLGEPELGALPRRHGAPDARRRCPPCARVRDQPVRVVFVVPAIPRRHRGGSGDRRPRCADHRQDPALPRPPRSHPGARRRGRCGAGHATGGSTPDDPDRVHRALDPGVHGRVQRSRRRHRPLPDPTPRGCRARDGTRPLRTSVGTSCGRAAPDHRRCRGSSRTSTPTCAGWPTTA